MFFDKGIPQGIRALVRAAEHQAQAVKVSRFRLAKISPEKTGGADHQIRFVVPDDFTDFFIINGIGIGDNGHAVKKGRPQVGGLAKYMKIGQIGQKRIIFVEFISFGKTYYI